MAQSLLKLQYGADTSRYHYLNFYFLLFVNKNRKEILSLTLGLWHTSRYVAFINMYIRYKVQFSKGLTEGSLTTNFLIGCVFTVNSSVTHLTFVDTLMSRTSEMIRTCAHNAC